jgi:RimJ/RimL family protein N-acetyltransferase/glycosyltransferase involved in cell wall biosynthesis
MYNVLIRPLIEADALLSWKWRNDPEVWQYTGSKPDQYITHEIEKIWIEKVLLDTTSRRFAILVNDEYVGNIQLTNIEKNKTAEYHIFIGNKTFWGKNIAFLATLQIIRFAKTILNLEEIYLNVNTDNIPAIKVYEKCNFKQVNDNIKMVLNLSLKRLPKVSVFMMVYNHEKFIKEALDGVLMQKCNFDYEIVIGEDYSTDESRNIILEYAKQFPGKFKLLLHTSNIGAQKNQLAVLENCTGQYIAMCEGDDYWTDPLKLQKQVDFLEKNEEFVISCSNSNIVNFESSYVKLFNENKIPEITDVNYILRNKWYIPTASIVFRNNMIEFPNWFYKVKNGDYMLCLFLTSNGGLVHYENEVRCDYRLHENGVSNIFKKKNTFNYSMLYNNKMFNDYSKGKYNQLIKINIEYFSLNILGQLPIFSKEFWKVLFNLIGYNKTLSRNLFFFFKKRISLKKRLINIKDIITINHNNIEGL